jgi:hypothetical protein
MDLDSVEPVLRSAEQTVKANQAKLNQTHAVLRRVSQVLERMRHGSGPDTREDGRTPGGPAGGAWR